MVGGLRTQGGTCVSHLVEDTGSETEGTDGDRPASLLPLLSRHNNSALITRGLSTGKTPPELLNVGVLLHKQDARQLRA